MWARVGWGDARSGHSSPATRCSARRGRCGVSPGAPARPLRRDLAPCYAHSSPGALDGVSDF